MDMHKTIGSRAGARRLGGAVACVALLAVCAGAAAQEKQTPAPAARQGDASSQTAAQPAAVAPAAQAERMTAEAMQEAIRRGVEHLTSRQEADGGWPYEDNNYRDFYNAWGLLGLVHADLDPKKDEVLRKALNVVFDPAAEKRWYLANFTRVLRILSLCRLRGGLSPALRAQLAADVKSLCEGQNDDGSWGWTVKSSSYNGNTLEPTWLALLALTQSEQLLNKSELAATGLSGEVWLRAADPLLATQLPDGGWNRGGSYYMKGKDGPAPSVGWCTAASVDSLMRIRSALCDSAPCSCSGARRTVRRVAREVEMKMPAIEAGINKGLAWLDKEFPPAPATADRNSQHLGLWLHRIWETNRVNYYGKLDWRSALAKKVSSYDPLKEWDTRDVAIPIVFFDQEKKSLPVLVSKMRLAGDWNSHPRDLANLTAWLSEQRKETLDWQVVNPEVPAQELGRAPLLYITAESKVELSDAEQKRLREFTDGGGTVFLEASCGNHAAAQSLEALCRQAWPEWPLRRIDEIDGKHPIWTADMPVSHRALSGLDDGLRTFVFYSPMDISSAWQNNEVRTKGDVFRFGANLGAYSTAGLKLADWWSARQRGVGAKYADQVKNLKAGPKKTIAVARIKYGEGKAGDEWRLGENYQPWQLLAADLKEKLANPTAKVLWKETTEIALKVLDPVAVGAAVPAETDLLYLCGRTRCDLGENGAKWLKDYLAGGGFLLAEAALGDTRFDEPLKKTLSAAGLTVKPMLEALKEAGIADNPLLTGKLLKEARGYEVSRVEFSPALAAELAAKAAETPPALWAICDGPRMVGIYSPYDLMFSQTGCRAWGLRGYWPDDARALATNLVLLLSAR